MNPDGEYSMFEYLYRDAGNYKTHGRVLLRGRVLTEDDAAIRRALDDDTFNHDAVGLPSLHAQHWSDCGSEFAAELDHPLHELTALRAARPDEIEGLSADGSIAQLAASPSWQPGSAPSARMDAVQVTVTRGSTIHPTPARVAGGAVSGTSAATASHATPATTRMRRDFHGLRSSGPLIGRTAVIGSRLTSLQSIPSALQRAAPSATNNTGPAIPDRCAHHTTEPQ